MVLMTLKEISLRYGGNLILDNINLSIKFRERICLIGRNGVGKTTLMKVIAGLAEPDKGDILRFGDIHSNYLTQGIPSNIEGDAFQVICSGLGDVGKVILMYRQLEKKSTLDGPSISGDEFERLQGVFDTESGWLVRSRVENIIHRMNIPNDTPVSNLSAGMQRRVFFARAIVTDPELLLLDEPTNHMDLNFISYLETFLLEYKKTLIFITHDRSMITNLATRIVEIDRGKIISWKCDYETYLNRKKKYDTAESRRERSFDKKISNEEAWIRQGIKARRSRNEGRVRALIRMRELRRKRQNKMGEAKVKIAGDNNGGRLVIEANDVIFSYESAIKPIVEKLTCKIMRGDRVGIIGPNGCGKTTLVRLLLKYIDPDFGSVHHGTKIKIAYFDQCRAQIDREKTARDNVFDGNDVFEISGKCRHAIGYLRDFLFSPDRSSMPSKQLSGGEINRLLLAKLFTNPANLLVFDEPTNDLDLETLELLEDLLLNYKGTILLVSHDRSFIDHVVTDMIVFDDSGKIESFVGGCPEWYGKYFQTEVKRIRKPQVTNCKIKNKVFCGKKNKIGYMESFELECLPDRIEVLEKRQQELFDTMSKINFYKQGSNQIIGKKRELTKIQKRLEKAYSRWEFLESLTLK